MKTHNRFILLQKKPNESKKESSYIIKLVNKVKLIFK